MLRVFLRASLPCRSLPNCHIVSPAITIGLIVEITFSFVNAFLPKQGLKALERPDMSRSQILNTYITPHFSSAFNKLLPSLHRLSYIASNVFTADVTALAKLIFELGAIMDASP